MTEKAKLEIVGISKRFGGVLVFDEISFSLDPGEILGVIGPNGAGKTTLINIVCGKLPPSTGSVRLGGQDVTGAQMHSMARAGVVRTFQQTNTFKTASVRENISRAMRFAGSRQVAWASIADMLEEFELSQRLDERSDSLPYGLQKMLGLMLTYVTSPRVLLMDEPAAGLEGRERTRIDSFVGRACGNLGCSVMIVEHDMDLVKRLCPNILVLDAGRLIASGPPAEVLSRKDVIDAYVGAQEEEEA
ncbi:MULTISPECIES: ABC transporter ATP-binding protein [unclassified Chelatococcus]|uniref:ABC transporter ATP-binding protein n=1 Tax=unclassified Chelatococcus TaxID=2638111 RepID=UPI001BCBAA9E|nr:ABC transporter ATP-binding protein [Chelatococcus sp.]MBS7701360.1 ABC transporter ATP-binding protein [Chelatococcus sp. YT9]MBX3557440.1 ABC transporter ATP-binding protein [Chelatococcus sp.]